MSKERIISIMFKNPRKGVSREGKGEDARRKRKKIKSDLEGRNTKGTNGGLLSERVMRRPNYTLSSKQK